MILTFFVVLYVYPEKMLVSLNEVTQQQVDKLPCLWRCTHRIMTLVVPWPFLQYHKLFEPFCVCVCVITTGWISMKFVTTINDSPGIKL